MKTPNDGMIPTHRSLITRLKNWDDRESWREFFDTYWRLIYRFARRAGLSDAEAQDVVQETCIHVAKQMPSFHYDPAKGTFKGWLLRAVKWRIDDQFRKRPDHYHECLHRTDDSHQRTPTAERIPDPKGMEIERLWDAEYVVNLQEAALEYLKRKVKPKHFQVFDLYVIKKLPVDQVIRTLGVNRAQVYLVKSRLSRLLLAEVKKLQQKDSMG